MTGPRYLRFIFPLNAVPWSTPPFSVGRNKKGGSYVRPGQNRELKMYQNAVKAELVEHPDCRMLEPPYAIRFWFYRRMEPGTTGGGRVTKPEEADATNMQKATEDALQGVIINDDVHARTVISHVVEQGPDAPSIVVIEVWGNYGGAQPDPELQAAINRVIERQGYVGNPDANAWPGGGW